MKIDYTLYILTYNRINILSNFINNLLKNIDLNFNIHVFDNGSDDGTINFIKKIDKILYTRIEKNIGAINGMNAIIENVNTQYFSLLCDDDFINIDFIHKSVEILKQDQTIGFVCSKNIVLNQITNKYYYFNNYWSTKKYFPSFRNLSKLYKNNFPPSAIVFNKKHLTNILNINLIGDETTFICSIANNAPFKFIDMLGGIFSVSIDSISGGQGGIEKKFSTKEINQSYKKEIQSIDNLMLSKEKKRNLVKISKLVHEKYINKKNQSPFYKNKIIFITYFKYWYYSIINYKHKKDLDKLISYYIKNENKR